MENDYPESGQSSKYGTEKHKPTRTQLQLLECIDEAGKDGLCRSKEALAHDLSCSTKTIDRGVAHLCVLGLIEVKPSYLSTGRQTANIYRTCESAREEVDWYCLVAERQAKRV